LGFVKVIEKMFWVGIIGLIYTRIFAGKMIDEIFRWVVPGYDLKNLSYEDDVVFVATLMFGDREHIEILKKKLGKEKFKQKLQKNFSKLDKKTANYWAVVFDLDVDLKNNLNLHEEINKPIFRRSARFAKAEDFGKTKGV